MRRTALLVFIIVSLLVQSLFPAIIRSDLLFAILVSVLLITGIILAIRAYRRAIVVGRP